jgi:lipopolysaccharide/colanic/teichoic acid biosynthesis glycosyltransferase
MVVPAPGKPPAPRWNNVRLRGEQGTGQRSMRYLAWGVFALSTILSMVGLGAIMSTASDGVDLGSPGAVARLVILGVIAASIGFAFGLPDQPFLRQRMRASLAASLATAAVVAVGHTFAADALVPGRLLVAAIPVLWLVEVVVSTAIAGTTSRGAERVVVIGPTADFAVIVRDHRQHMEIDCVLVTHVPSDEPTRLATLVELIREERITLVVVADDVIELPSVTEALTAVHLGGTRIHTLTDFYSQCLGKIPLRHLQVSALLFDVRELHHYGYLRVSRVLDVVLALVGVVLLAVAVPFVALGNLLGNPGPLFFSQPRVGRNQEIFRIHKFRTMRPGPTTGDWTSPNDPRITPFGHIMRSLHLDELPQMVNVLRGELSIVGPRPEQPHYVERLADQIPFYVMRHLVRPGLTGWAQVNYPYGANEVDAFEKLQFELWYLNHQSIWLDLRIVLRTVRHVFGFVSRPVRQRDEVTGCTSLTS